MSARPTTGWSRVEVKYLLPGITRWFFHTSGLHVSRPVGRPARISIFRSDDG